MPVPPDEMIYGDGERGPDGPRIVCCACGRGPVYRMAPPLCAECDPALERAAADLWRRDNPTESVFSCGYATKVAYRRKALGYL